MSTIEITIQKASIEENASELVETILMAQKNENTMLPFMDRLNKILPDLNKMLKPGVKEEIIKVFV